jgi:hypothetical protein
MKTKIQLEDKKEMKMNENIKGKVIYKYLSFIIF